MTVHAARPRRMKLDPSDIPGELKLIPHWLVWNWSPVQKQDGSTKWDKPPLSIDGTSGSSTDPEKWCVFEEAVASVQAGKFDGIGLAMGPDGIGLVGVDLDGCRDPATGFITVEAQEIVDSLNTYFEISPSGTGLKGWLSGTYDKSKWRSKSGDIETYSKGRYFTVTSQKINDKPIAQVGDSFYAFLDKYLSKDQPKSKDQPQREKIETSDEPARKKHAINSCLKVEYDAGTEGDGSKRLVKYCRQCVRAGLSADGCVQVIRAVEVFSPFPVQWTAEQIKARYESATTQSEVGEAIQVYEQSDYGVTKRVRDYCQGSILYISEWSKWVAWNGRAFEVDRRGKLVEAIVAISKQLLADTPDDPKEAKAWAGWCMGYQSKRGIENVEKLARQFMAADYRDLDQRTDLWHVENGVVRLTGTAKPALEPHNRSNLNTKVCGVPFIPDAACVRWRKFIEEITAGDVELQIYLQKVVGYCLTGTPSQELFILYGSGGNGKGVFTRTLLKLLGDYGGVISQDLLMNSPNQHPTQFAYLYGRRAVVAQETGADCTLNENQVKMLTGSDAIQCRRMREDFWEFKPTHKILLATNNKPLIKGSDHGIWRRVKLIPFSAEFVTPDTKLDETLDSELPGILQWAIEGYRLFQLEGFAEPECVLAAKGEYKADMSVVGQFVEDRCILSDGLEVSTAKLYANYKMYCEEHGHFLCSARKLNNDLATIFKVKNGRSSHSRTKVGIGMREE